MCAKTQGTTLYWKAEAIEALTRAFSKYGTASMALRPNTCERASANKKLASHQDAAVSCCP